VANPNEPLISLIVSADESPINATMRVQISRARTSPAGPGPDRANARISVWRLTPQRRATSPRERAGLSRISLKAHSTTEREPYAMNSALVCPEQ